MNANTLLLGVDGGGTRCRVRLSTAAGDRLGEATGGPANVRFGLEQSFSAVLHATSRCLEDAGLSARDFPRIVACLALAGASEPNELRAVQKFEHPFGRIFVTNDAHAACVGAHRGRDGGVIVIGTGTVGWAELNGRHIRVGGWGMPVSDEGSGAWLGCEALRRVLWAHDGRIPWTDMLAALFRQFQSDPHAIVRWATHAAPRDFATLAPVIVDHGADPVAAELMRLAAGHVDGLAARLAAAGVERLAVTGGLSSFIAPFLSEATRCVVVAPSGDALDGALQLARMAAGAAAA